GACTSPTPFPTCPTSRSTCPAGSPSPSATPPTGCAAAWPTPSATCSRPAWPPPPRPGPPGAARLSRYVAPRLLDTLSLPFGPAPYLKLMPPALPDGDLPLVRG